MYNSTVKVKKVNKRKVDPENKKISSSEIVNTSQKSVKWTNDLKLKVAQYIQDNYHQYKIMAKMAFARKMRDSLAIVCTDIQIKNLLQRMVKVYTDIKTKLNTSGFGIDFENDKSLDKGWIFKQCPYYDILDEVMSSRPNIIPPFTLESTAVGIAENFEQSDFIEDNESREDVCQNENDIEITTDTEEMDNQTDPVETESVKEGVTNKAVGQQIQQLFKGIGIAKPRAEGNSSKNALSAFSQILADKITATTEVETQKYELEKKRFQHSQTHDDNLLDMERTKMQVDKEVSLYKINTEKEIKLLELQDKKDDRQFELRKLELLIQLEKEKQKT